MRTKFPASLVATKRSFTSALPQPAEIPSRHRAYVSLSMEDVKTLRRIGWNWTAFVSMRSIFPELSNSVVAKNALARASSDFIMSFFGAKNAELMQRRFLVFPG